MYRVTGKSEVKHLQSLMRVPKDRGIVKKFRGKQVKPQDMIISRTDNDGKEEINLSHIVTNCTKFTWKHVGYHASVITYGLEGVYKLDKEIPLYSATSAGSLELTGHIALRQVLY